MTYKLTMERTLRMAVDFEAANDEEAEQKASNIFYDAMESPEQFEIADVEGDYALTDDTHRIVVDWS